jgi:hypothetical protein
MGSILQFRRAVEFVSGEYPFSVSFGAVRTRKDCVTSAQMLFERLMGDAPGSFLDFETLCLITRDRKGEIDRATVKEMIQVFRPNRNGQLSKLDFVKSVDRYDNRYTELVFSWLLPPSHAVSGLQVCTRVSVSCWLPYKIHKRLIERVGASSAPC